MKGVGVPAAVFLPPLSLPFLPSCASLSSTSVPLSAILLSASTDPVIRTSC